MPSISPRLHRERRPGPGADIVIYSDSDLIVGVAVSKHCRHFAHFRDPWVHYHNPFQRGGEGNVNVISWGGSTLVHLNASGKGDAQLPENHIPDAALTDTTIQRVGVR